MQRLVSYLLFVALFTNHVFAQGVAEKPPMGWNSYDCFGFLVNEDQVKANADYMDEHLKEYGWEYVVVDFLWYVKGLTVDAWTTWDVKPKYQDSIIVDEYGRMLPRTDLFPSSAADSSFKSLAGYIHSKGLKFGIHLMRGIPKSAVKQDLPIKGTSYLASDIVDPDTETPWYKGMEGVDMDKPGAQEYYNSLIELYASWGVDYLKIDGIATRPYREKEIIGYYNAVQNTGRDIVISLSPGSAHLEEAEVYQQYSNLWRIKGDVWDKWSDIEATFPLCNSWNEYREPNSWPDADMLPLGKISISSEALYAHDLTPRMTRLTEDEQFTMMSLWSIFRSPLMFGGHLPENDTFTLNLITNQHVIGVNQNSINNKQLKEGDGYYYWTAQEPDSSATYLAMFNTSDSKQELDIEFDEVDIQSNVKVFDLWKKEETGVYANSYFEEVNKHGVAYLKLTPTEEDITGDKTPPSAPTNLSATGSDGSVSLSWDDNMEADLAGYNVYRSTTSGNGYTMLNGSLLSSPEHTDNSVDKGTTYYYVVTAVDDSGNESSYSGEANATPEAGTNIHNFANVPFNLYPNPVQNRFYLRRQQISGAKEAHLSILDMTGKVLMSCEMHGNFQQPVMLSKNIPNGMYICVIRTEKGVKSQLLEVKR